MLAIKLQHHRSMEGQTWIKFRLVRYVLYFSRYTGQVFTLRC